MAELLQEDFKFPDEIDKERAQTPTNVEIDLNDPTKIEIEIEDDTPEADRNRPVVSQEDVRKLEVDTDELDKYSKEAKDKLIKMKRIWHDERREKEQAVREQYEAVNLAQNLYKENERIREILASGTKEYASTLQNAAGLELEMAKKSYKEAYESGDSDKIVDAQQAMQQANFKVMQAQNFRAPPLQQERFEVQQPQEQFRPAPPPMDKKVLNWQDNNSWFGQNKRMTATALGIHEDLKDSGVEIGSDEYYDKLDNAMRETYPKQFVSEEPTRTKPSTVVAPAMRSTASNKIRLKTSQVQLAKKLGITPEQYALAVRKLEN